MINNIECRSNECVIDNSTMTAYATSLLPTRCKEYLPSNFSEFIKKKPGAKCLPGFRFIRQIAGLTANLLHRLQNTLI
ncbi:hypothetical protein FPS11_19460 [Escherichia coli]|uniref:Uncharacterized protein n=1 Tax=Escherichia coli TaxID=562 RepID=A0A8S7EJ78_ECOLX|nr:hypothetical protein [Escherichia coli]EFB3637121.1 hypothetical protein [Escherichia coli]EFB5255291.1 hypothetical protein [Escherichia coli]